MIDKNNQNDDLNTEEHKDVEVFDFREVDTAE